MSTSGVLAKGIDLPVPFIIFARSILGGTAFFLYYQWKKISLKINPKDKLVIIPSGLLMGIHWTSYFYALKLSNVAIDMLSFFTYPIITALLEQLFLNSHLQKQHLLLGFLYLNLVLKTSISKL